MRSERIPWERIALALVVYFILGLALACAGASPTATPSPTITPTHTATPPPTATVTPSPTPVPATGTPLPTLAVAETAPVPTSTPEQGEKPVYGGILMRAHDGDPRGFDPVHDTGIGTLLLIAPSYSQLIRFSPTEGMGTIEPELATSWEFSEDGLQLTFHLRKGVKWQDGQLFTSEDVIYWFNRFLHPPEGIRSTQSGPFTHVASVSAPDPYTVTFSMTFPTASTLPNFAGGHLMIHSRHVVEEATRDDVFALHKNPELIVGTGPFLFDEYQEDVKFCSKRNPDYWNQGKPYLDGMCHIFIKDSTARFAALATGQVHMSMHGSRSLTPAQAQQARSDFPNKIVVNRHLAPFWTGVRYNADNAPFNDVRVRKALKLAVRLEEYMATVAGGEGAGVGVISGYMPPGSFWALPKDELMSMAGYRQPKEEDIAEAKRLMAEAGYSKGLEVSFVARDETLRKNQALFLADQWKKTLGITTKVEAMSLPLLIERSLRGDFGVISSGVAVNIIDPDSLLHNPYHSESPGLFAFTATDPELDRLLDEQRRVFDPSKRRELTWAAERIIQNELIPDFVLQWNMYIYGQSPEVGGFQALDFMLYNQLRFDHVWLKR